MDFDAFRPRVEAVAATGENAEVQELLEAWHVLTAGTETDERARRARWAPVLAP